MRIVSQWLFDRTALLAAILCAVLIAAVFLSFIDPGVSASSHSSGGSWLVLHYHGCAIFGVADHPLLRSLDGDGDVAGVIWYYFIGDRLSCQWTFAGARYEELRDPTFAGQVSWALAIPYSPVIVATLGLPVLCVYSRAHKKRRVERGRCENCGYDLRATPHRCPECGTIARGKITRSTAS